MFGRKKIENPEAQYAQISATEWLNEVLKEAVKQKASDIHIVPLQDRMTANFRIDGVMQVIDEWDKENHEKVISRIKVLAGMDVVEKQVPQDGHMEILLNWPKKEGKRSEPTNHKEEKKPTVTLKVKSAREVLEEKENGTADEPERNENSENKGETSESETKPTNTAAENSEVETGEKRKSVANFRVSLMPTIHGETAVLRALNRAENLMDIENLGFSERMLPIVLGIIRRSHGMVLLTGPTGSGKSTTLYSILNKIRSKESTILTLEDPVEYSLDGIRQTQIRSDEEFGVSWSEGLKATLRQDPDVLMIGEIRDAETAEIAIHAALAGRLVFSTFHTNNVEGVITQLLDMDIARSSIAASLTGIITQRLVRKVCDQCTVEEPASLELLNLLGVHEWNNGNIKAGEGCRACGGTGYRGRIGIYEILAMDDELRATILQKNSFEELGAVVKTKILQTLTEDGLAKVREGITTIEEVVRVVI
ncbi:MAG TPA: GspE/PulE family protein [Candidatus Paceibacterota bacterium]|nr:GspE/PulE family protein [Candidatus Paceibacterota bacterium]